MKEEELIRKAIKGNKKSLQELLIIHSDRLYRTALLYVKNREDALDIVQETSYKAFLSIDKLRNESYFLTWLTKILINSCYDLLKKRDKEVLVNYNLELGKGSGETKAETLDLLHAINQLKEGYKTVIILFYFNDLPLSEIAKIMSIPENTVKTYLSRGKQQLKKELGGMDDEGRKITSSGL